MLERARRSLAEQIYKQYKDEEPSEETWLIVYDFQGIKPTSKFYDNINRIRTLLEDGQLIQYSVYRTARALELQQRFARN